jgi:hypothetical protein
VADAGHPPPGRHLIERTRRVFRAYAVTGSASDRACAEGHATLSREEAVRAIAIRTAQTTWEGLLASGTGTVWIGSGAAGELPVT